MKLASALPRRRRRLLTSLIRGTAMVPDANRSRTHVSALAHLWFPV